ncbi:MAG: Ig-like domain-containing protein, partial [Bacteroidota bacterium]|nr:Ig-like domain-containing protein [Bacteroidota bacterium]
MKKSLKLILQFIKYLPEYFGQSILVDVLSRTFNTFEVKSYYRKFYFLLFILSFLQFSTYAQDNLTISKTLTTVPSKPGDPVQYQIYYSNLNSSGTASNIVIIDSLPPADLFTYVSSTGTYNSSSRTITWSGLSLAANTGATLTVTGTCGILGGPSGLYDASSYYISNGGSSQTVSNNASIKNPTLSSPIFITTPVTNNVTEYCGASMPDSLTGYIKSATNSQIYYLLTITNSGNITDKYTLTNSSPGTGQPIPYYIETVDGTTITETPWIQPGSSYSFIARYKAAPGTKSGTVNATAVFATSFVCGTVDSTNIITNVYGGQPPASSSCDLQITNTASPNPVAVGNNLVYTITVVNNSAAKTASNVLIIDTLPSTVSLVSYTASSGITITSPSSNKIRALKNSQKNTDGPIIITVTVTPNCNAVPSISNYAVASTTTPDDDSTNDNTTITTTVNSNITAPTSSGTTICSGSTAPLTASSSLSSPGYNWYDASTGGTLLHNGSSFTTPALSATTTFSVSTYDTGNPGCESNRTPVTVTVLTTPVITTQPSNTSVCTGNNTTFTVAASGTSLSYQWQVNTGSGFTNISNVAPYSGITNTTLTITGAKSGMNTYQYRCVVKTGTCTAINSNAGILTVNALPIITGTLSVCVGSTTQLTASVTAAASSPWVSGSTGVATVSNTGLVTGVASGTSVITYTNNNGCSITATVTVNALPATPTISAGGPTTFCSGGSVKLTSSAGTTYLWSTGATASNISPTISGSYTVQVTNASGCQSASSAATVVTVNALPATPTISASGPTTFCTGGSVTLTSSAGTSYLWSTGATTSSISPTTAGSYTVKVTNASGCQSTSSAAKVVTVNALPATPTISAGGSTTFCAGGSVTLTSSAGTTYLWSTGATTSSISPTTAGSYTVKVTNASGCQSASSAAKIVTVNALPATPTISAGGPTTFCSGGSVTLTSSAGTSYLWSTGATT